MIIKIDDREIEIEKIRGQWACAENIEGTYKKVMIDGKTLKKVQFTGLGEVRGKYRFELKELDREDVENMRKSKKLNQQNEWIKENYDRVSVTLPKGTKEKIKSLGYSVNEFLNEAVKVMLEANETQINLILERLHELDIEKGL